MGLVGRNMAVLLGGAAMTILLGAQAGWAQEATDAQATEQQQEAVVNAAEKKARVTLRWLGEIWRFCLAEPR